MAGLIAWRRGRSTRLNPLADLRRHAFAFEVRGSPDPYRQTRKEGGDKSRVLDYEDLRLGRFDGQIRHSPRTMRRIVLSHLLPSRRRMIATSIQRDWHRMPHPGPRLGSR